MNQKDIKNIWLATQSFRDPQPDGGLAFRNEHLFPDCRLEGINLGSAGILLGWLTLRRGLPPGALRVELDDALTRAGDCLARAPLSVRSAGLFTGDAGVAVALVTLGLAQRNEKMVDAGWRRFENAVGICEETDFFSGRAGVVFAATLLERIIDDSRWTERARASARNLQHRLRSRWGLLGIPASGRLDGNQDLFLGAAHGSAGLALALNHFGHAVGDPEMQDRSTRIMASLLEHGTDEASGFLKARASRGGHQASSSDAAWCHGNLGLLWCLGQMIDGGHGLTVRQRAQLERILLRVTQARRYDNPTLCHGVAGQLETLQMLAAHPAFIDFSPELTRAFHHARDVVRALRHRSLAPDTAPWASEDPDTFTPDLWVGFLGPACALLKAHLNEPAPLLSVAWLRRLAEVPNSR
jgi:hypothetical protein